MGKSTSEIVYDQAVRAVEQQVDQLDELRNRTAVVLAAGGVVTGFLGRDAFSSHLGPFGYCALLAFVVAACFCIGVFLPRWDSWEFSINARSLMPYFLNESAPETPDALFAYLAGQIQDDWVANKKQLDGLFGRFNVACVALALEIVLWFLAFVLD